jgi:glutamate-1-semialdehyde 2,1-aminomutase
MLYTVLGAIAAIYLLRRLQIRLRLSRAKHPSLRGHAKFSRRMARLVPFYAYPDSEIFRVDNAPANVVGARQQGFERLAQYLSRYLRPARWRSVNSWRTAFRMCSLPTPTGCLSSSASYVRQHLKTGALAQASSGVRLQDLDGNWSYDLTGAYGVNLYGYDFYKDCIDKGAELVKALGPVLGPYHPVILDNVQRITALSGMDEVSFHMSGTEAVMQAVRLACYHTDRSRVVVFCGAYHGWWDGVQPGPGNQRRVNDVYTLNEMSENTLHVLRTRKDIACVLVNPLQALNPNGGANSDSLLLASDRTADYDRKAYTVWLQKAAAGLHRAPHRADFRRGVPRVPPGSWGGAGIFWRRGRHGDLWQNPGRRSAGGCGGRQTPSDAALQASTNPWPSVLRVAPLTPTLMSWVP